MVSSCILLKIAIRNACAGHTLYFGGISSTPSISVGNGPEFDAACIKDRLKHLLDENLWKGALFALAVLQGQGCIAAE